MVNGEYYLGTAWIGLWDNLIRTCAYIQYSGTNTVLDSKRKLIVSRLLNCLFPCIRGMEHVHVYLLHRLLLVTTNYKYNIRRVDLLNLLRHQLLRTSLVGCFASNSISCWRFLCVWHSQSLVSLERSRNGWALRVDQAYSAVHTVCITYAQSR